VKVITERLVKTANSDNLHLDILHALEVQFNKQLRCVKKMSGANQANNPAAL